MEGRVFGRLTVQYKGEDYEHPSGYSRNRWVCSCICGNTKLVHESSLLGGTTKSCGCLSAETAKENKTTHGLSKDKLYGVWASMKNRCDNENFQQYQDYGGRGITYDNNWSDFYNFYQDMHETYSEGLELDRVDVNGIYCKENCRWVDLNTQAYNKRLYENNTSGKAGVSYRKDCNKWQARISVGGVRINLGFYLDKSDAISAREIAEIKYYGEVKQ